MGMNMQKMMKQVQKMQSDMAKVQDELKACTVEGSSGGGMITATVTGAQEVVAIKIKPEAVDPNDVEMLEDLVLAAIKDAMRASKEMATNEMQKITGGMNVPGLF